MARPIPCVPVACPPEPLQFPRRHTPEETAEILGLSVATLARERRRGRIRAYVAGEKRVYYLDHEIVSYFERRTESWDEKSSNPAGSETIGCQSSPALPSGTEHGS